MTRPLFCLLLLWSTLMYGNTSPVSRLILPLNGSIKTQQACLYQDSLGYLYLGNQEGLYRFNGREWKRFWQPEATGHITAITQFQKKIWVGTSKGQLLYLQADSLTTFEPEEGLPGRPIRQLLAVGKQLWFGTAGEGLYCQDGRRQYLFDQADGLRDLTINSLMAHAGEVWVGTDQGLYAVQLARGNKKVRSMPIHDPLISGLAISHKKIWVSFRTGGLQYLAADSMLRLPGNVDGIKQLAGYQHKLWLLNDLGHLWSYDTQRNRLVHMAIKIQNRHLRIEQFLVDYHGSLWLLTNQGLVLAQPGIGHFTLPAGMHVQAMYADTAQNLYLGTTRGLYVKYNDGRLEIIHGTSGFNILALHRDRDGDLWIGTYGQGLHCLRQNKLISLGATHGLVNKNIFSFAQSDDGSELYFATLGGVFTLWLAQKFEKNAVRSLADHHKSGPGTYYIYSLFKQKNGPLWVGTDGKGSYAYDGENFKHFVSTPEAEFRIVTAMQATNDGRLWMNTLDAGLLSEEASTFALQLPADLQREITSMAPTPRNNLLLGFAQGLGLYNTSNKQLYNIDRLYQLPYLETLTNSVYYEDDRIFMGGKEGYFLFELSLLPELKVPVISIHPPRMPNGQMTETPRRFTSSQNNLLFPVDVLWYANPEAVNIRYRLEGLQSEWVRTNRQEITFQGLQPGNYVLWVGASFQENFGDELIASYVFSISKPIYARWWFIACITLLAIGLAVLYVRWREQQQNQLAAAKREQIRAQFELLRNQISPHFLFNSFNTLLELIEAEPIRASRYVEKLSILFRKVLSYKDVELITVAEELELVQAYTYLQQERFGSMLRINIKITPELLNRLLIPMSLQLLVENAIKHNRLNKQNPLSISITNQLEVLVVSNSLQPRTVPEPSTGFGLRSLQQRYKTLYQRDVQVESNDQSFTVSIPTLEKT
jgi:ligand-binding sensor domain-containing protein